MLTKIGLTSIFNDRNVMTACQINNRVHFTRVSKQVGDDNAPRSFRDFGGNRFSSDIVSQRVDIGEDGNGSLVDDWCDSTHIRYGTGNNLITRLGVDASDRRVNTCRPRSCCPAKPDAVLFGKPFLKFLHHGSLGAVEGSRPNDPFEDFELLLSKVSSRSVRIAWELHDVLHLLLSRHNQLLYLDELE